MKSLHLVAALMTNISVTLLNQLYRPFVQLLKFVRRMCYLCRFVAQLFDHLTDFGKKIFFLFFRICVVITQVAYTIMGSRVSESINDFTVRIDTNEKNVID